jgi:hypothetical protein
MARESQESFYYKVEQLENLIIDQQKALKMADELLDMKSTLIELCEEETEFYKTKNKRLTRSLMISAVLFAILGVINVIRLLLL